MTSGPGEAGVDSRTFADLSPGTYDAAETVPDNWNLDSATCDDGSSVDAIELSAGETVTCRFVDSQETGAIEITKTRKHAADGAGDHPHAGVTFTISGGSLQAPSRSRLTPTASPATTVCSTVSTRSPRPCRAATSATMR